MNTRLLNLTSTFISGFGWSGFITAISLLAGAVYAYQFGALQADAHGLEVVQQSLLRIVIVQFALTGMAIAFLLRKKGLRREILVLLFVPFLTIATRYLSPESIIFWLVVSNWAVMWRITYLRATSKGAAS